MLAITVFASLAALGPASGTTAQDGARAQATSKVYEAERLFDETRFEESLQRLEEAHALFPSAKLDLNFGKTYRALGRDADALAAFERFLAKTDPEDPVVAAHRPLAEQQVRELRDKSVQAPSPPDTPRPAPPAPAPTSLVATTPVGAAPPAPTPPPLDKSIALSMSTAPAASSEPGPPFYRRWWFWTGAAAVVAGAVTAGVLLSGPREPSSLCSPKCRLGDFRIRP